MDLADLYQSPHYCLDSLQSGTLKWMEITVGFSTNHPRTADAQELSIASHAGSPHWNCIAGYIMFSFGHVIMYLTPSPSKWNLNGL